MPLKPRFQRPILYVVTAASCLVLSALTIWVFPSNITNFFSSPYMPHGYCFLWDKQLVSLHVGSDILIWLSYCTIAITLTSIAYQNRQKIPFGWMLLAFGGFIVACGFTHFMQIVVLWQPLYWLEGDVKLITAIASVTTACLLPPKSSWSFWLSKVVMARRDTTFPAP